MASTNPVMPWCVYNEKGVPVARLVHAEDAAMLVASLGDGYTIRNGPTVVWREGKEAYPAGESYDGAAIVMHERTTAAFQASVKRAASRLGL